MPEPLKNMYNPKSIGEYASQIKEIYPAFLLEEFIADILDDSWEELELKARGRRITENMGKYLPEDYPKAIGILNQVAPKVTGFFAIIFPDFVEVFGQEEKYWDISIAALEEYTKYSSSEFAVRPFIINHEEKMMAQMLAWSKDENEDVRRLSSEGCRPALPWAMALPKYKKDPTPILPILEQLKADSSLYVRKSVANNINDISKSTPEVAIELAKRWIGMNKDTDWIIKHGLRTLLKQGHREALGLFGYHDSSALKVTNFKIDKGKIPMEGEITFSFDIQAKEDTKLRLEYGVDYMKANGKRNRKIFQISESALKKGEKKSYEKKHSFEELSTRKHYPGLHSITLIVNGVEGETLDFELMKG